MPDVLHIEITDAPDATCRALPRFAEDDQTPCGAAPTRRYARPDAYVVLCDEHARDFGLLSDPAEANAFHGGSWCGATPPDDSGIPGPCTRPAHHDPHHRYALWTWDEPVPADGQDV